MRVIKWKDIIGLVDEMFTHDYENGTLQRREVHFYGNDGVCLFKYFVNENDPQKMFVWSCLGVNLFCFFVISLCYGIINVKYEDSNENVGQVEDHLTNEELLEKEEFQRNIAFIIITDFVCWVPFIFICLLPFVGID